MSNYEFFAFSMKISAFLEKYQKDTALRVPRQKFEDASDPMIAANRTDF